jgi:hypothetical protein
VDWSTWLPARANRNFGLGASAQHALQSVVEGVYVKRANRPGKGSRVEDRVRIVWR